MNNALDILQYDKAFTVEITATFNIMCIFLKQIPLTQTEWYKSWILPEFLFKERWRLGKMQNPNSSLTQAYNVNVSIANFQIQYMRLNK
jgi:hypothetical protein